MSAPQPEPERLGYLEDPNRSAVGQPPIWTGISAEPKKAKAEAKAEPPPEPEQADEPEPAYVSSRTTRRPRGS